MTIKKTGAALGEVLAAAPEPAAAEPAQAAAGERAERLEKLFRFIWNEMATLESDKPEYAYVPYEDTQRIEDLCLAVERADEDGAAEPEDETPAYWQVRATLTRTLHALQLVALSPHDDLAAMARQALAEADALFSGEGDGDPGPREPGRYRATAEHLSGEVSRLNGLLVECGNENDRLKAERDRLVEGARALERVAGSHERALYAAWIEVRHGLTEAADQILAEQLDGYDGPQWNGHESGIEWLERTREDAPAGGACSECKDGLVPIGCCNCGSPADASVNYAHERLCGFEPCPNGCWERLHPAAGAGTEGAGA